MHIDFGSETQHTKGLGRSTGLKNACCSYIGLEHSSQHLHQVAHKQVDNSSSRGVPSSGFYGQCILEFTHTPPHARMHAK